MKKEKLNFTNEEKTGARKYSVRGVSSLAKFTSVNGNVYGTLALDTRRANDDATQELPVAVRVAYDGKTVYLRIGKKYTMDHHDDIFSLGIAQTSRDGIVLTEITAQVKTHHTLIDSTNLSDSLPHVVRRTVIDEDYLVTVGNRLQTGMQSLQQFSQHRLPAILRDHDGYLFLLLFHSHLKSLINRTTVSASSRLTAWFIVYLFIGEDIEIQNRYIARVAEVQHQKVKRVDSVSDVLKAGNASLFSEHYCYVCRDDMEFYKAENAWSIIDDMNMPFGSDNTLILLYTAIDKRSKFYSKFSDLLVVFNHLDSYVLKKHIKQHLMLTSDNANRLLRVCDNDYGQLLSEMDKVEQYKCAYPSMSDDQVFHLLLDTGAIYTPAEDEWVLTYLT